MPDAFAALKGVIEIATKLRDLSNKIKDAEAKHLIADLNLSLADLKEQLAELREENLDLRAQLKAAREQPDLRASLELRGKLYFFREPIRNRPAGPYCPRCFDADEKLMLVHENESPFDHFGKYACPQCQNHF